MILFLSQNWCVT